jgi:hypothetical protein
MFRFCLLFAGVTFLEKLDTILRQKTAQFKAENVHFNWIACAMLCLKMSADIVPLKHCFRLTALILFLAQMVVLTFNQGLELVKKEKFVKKISENK